MPVLRSEYFLVLQRAATQGSTTTELATEGEWKAEAGAGTGETYPVTDRIIAEAYGWHTALRDAGQAP